LIVFLERSNFGQDETWQYKYQRAVESDLSMKTQDCVVEAIDLMPVKDMWLIVASIVLLAAIGFVVLSLAVQWWDLTREPDKGD
jgi:hypothetical protein